MTAEALRRRVLRAVKRLGRRWLALAVELGARRLAAYMLGRAIVFDDRARQGVKPMWHRGRARRWRRIAAWLVRVSERALARACESVRGVVGDVPWVCEVAP